MDEEQWRGDAEGAAWEPGAPAREDLVAGVRRAPRVGLVPVVPARALDWRRRLAVFMKRTDLLSSTVSDIPGGCQKAQARRGSVSNQEGLLISEKSTRMARSGGLKGMRARPSCKHSQR